MIFSLRPEAEEDISNAARWYEEQHPGLGHEFLDEIKDTFTQIREFPESFSSVHQEVRRALTRRFPFGIYYQIEEERIVIFAILHGSRSPRHWRSRFRP